jgi:hypothetical protein
MRFSRGEDVENPPRSSADHLAEIDVAPATLRRHACGRKRPRASLMPPSMFWGDRMLLLDRAAGFLDDPAFRRAISSVSSSTGENQYASPNGISWRFHTLIWAARQALSVPGDFVECRGC